VRKTCVECKKRRRPSAYQLSPHRLGRAHGRCDDCQRRWYRNHNLFSRYGVTLEEYERIRDAQGGMCLSCEDVTEKLVVDHNHETCEVRGLLCGSCNLALGHTKDDPARLEALVGYLERHAD